MTTVLGTDPERWDTEEFEAWLDLLALEASTRLARPAWFHAVLQAMVDHPSIVLTEADGRRFLAEAETLPSWQPEADEDKPWLFLYAAADDPDLRGAPGSRFPDPDPP